MKKHPIIHELTNINKDNSIQKWARSYYTDPFDIDDLVQDTNLTVLRHFEKFVVNENPKGWIRKIMHTTFLNRFKKEVKDRSFIKSDEVLYNLDIENSGMGTPYEDLRVKEIHAHIEKLPQKIKQPIQMVSKGYQYQEVSETLEVPLNTVRTRIHKGRLDLEKSIE